MKWILIAATALCLSGCNEAYLFDKGDRVSTDVARETNNPCVVNIYLNSTHVGGDRIYRAHIEDCKQ